MAQVMESDTLQASFFGYPVEVMTENARVNRLAFDVLVLMDCTEGCAG